MHTAFEKCPLIALFVCLDDKAGTSIAPCYLALCDGHFCLSVSWRLSCVCGIPFFHGSWMVWLFANTRYDATLGCIIIVARCRSNLEGFGSVLCVCFRAVRHGHSDHGPVVVQATSFQGVPVNRLRGICAQTGQHAMATALVLNLASDSVHVNFTGGCGEYY